MKATEVTLFQARVTASIGSMARVPLARCAPDRGALMLEHLPALQVVLPLAAAPLIVLARNVRFAWLSRSGTGFFIVYNEGRDTYDMRPWEAVLGRTFIVKYTRQFDF